MTTQSFCQQFFMAQGVAISEKCHWCHLVSTDNSIMTVEEVVLRYCVYDTMTLHNNNNNKYNNNH